jgi:hypothetical protein
MRQPFLEGTKFVTIPMPKALPSFSQCTQRAPYYHESSFAERRNFSGLECSVAVLYTW